MHEHRLQSSICSQLICKNGYLPPWTFANRYSFQRLFARIDNCTNGNWHESIIPTISKCNQSDCTQYSIARHANSPIDKCTLHICHNDNCHNDVCHYNICHNYIFHNNICLKVSLEMLGINTDSS